MQWIQRFKLNNWRSWECSWYHRICTDPSLLLAKDVFSIFKIQKLTSLVLYLYFFQPTTKFSPIVLPIVSNLSNLIAFVTSKYSESNSYGRSVRILVVIEIENSVCKNSNLGNYMQPADFHYFFCLRYGVMVLEFLLQMQTIIILRK